MRARPPAKYFPRHPKYAAACAAQPPGRIALSPVARQSAAPVAPRPMPLTRRHCDPDSTCSSRRKEQAVDGPVPARSPSQFASLATATPRTWSCSMRDRQDAARCIHVPAANCLSPAPTHGDRRHRKAPNTPATHPFYRRVRSSHAISIAPSPPATAPLVQCSIRALQPTQHPQPVCLVPIRAEPSSGAASRPKTNPARNTNPDGPLQSSRDQQICFSFPDGIPGISRCDESRLECRAFPAPPTSHAATILRSEEHTSELQSRLHLVCRLLLEKKKKTQTKPISNSGL